MADATTARLANACGLPEFRSDAVLRMTIQMLERTSPSESGFLVVDAQGRRFVQAQASGRKATVKRILRSLAEPRQAARVGRAQGRSDDAWLGQAATIPLLGRTDLSAAFRSAAAANDDDEDNEDAGPTRRVRRRV